MFGIKQFGTINISCFAYIFYVQGEVKRAFGRDIFSHIESIVTGCQDILTCLPEAALLAVCSHLELRDIQALACTSKFMNKLCNSNAFWRKLYGSYRASPTSNLLEVSKKIGWKKIFCIRKAYQKETSQLRKHLMLGHVSI